MAMLIAEAPWQVHAAEPRRGWYLPVKSMLDRVAGLLLLLMLSPIMLLTAILVKCTSPGPVFYRQTRVGLGGRLFRIVKFRSMRQDAEAQTGAVWSRSGDQRITPLGKLLRATHLDEFPQLWNVVCGDMSLIGPRPERPEFVRRFELEIDHYADRHLVRPGITGIAQLRLPPDTDMESVRDKLQFDLFYVRHVGPWLDVITLVSTAIHFVASLCCQCLPSCLSLPTQKMAREHWDTHIAGQATQG